MKGRPARENDRANQAIFLQKHRERVSVVGRTARNNSGRGREIILDVEVTLNNRPLSYVEDDIELPILTPNSLLYGRANVVPELEPQRIVSIDLRKRAKRLRRCKDTV